jgi:hypothetical protein
MADMIKVPYGELFKRAQGIRQQADAVRNEIRTLSDTITSIQWMGKRAERFFQMWDEARPNLRIRRAACRPPTSRSNAAHAAQRLTVICWGKP